MFSMDGNHSLNKKSKKEDPNDVSLGLGQAFFVNHNDIAGTLKEIYANDDDVVVGSFFTNQMPTLTSPADTYMQRVQS